ncbi:hypothetical protein F2P47_07540 [Parvibaculum sedimenti]|uniref:Uncharacterized protein n=1 Tax=Parvibaculum sedimenti TaxID=2608632 RepID=A0A6N6VNI0_9HYPH|nr:hypothetical protein [Parvibaculum sedimenti]KAB7740376.1 hypothetical protein F2P47_07540 [Parvibaculum sedimenti]
MAITEMPMVWNSALSSAKYLELAKAEVRLNGIGSDAGNQRLMDEISDAFLEENEGLTSLLDSKNWNVSRPSVTLCVVINQAKSLTCRWHPANGCSADFQADTIERLLRDFDPGYDRPFSEIMWIRNFGGIYRRYFQECPIVRELLIFATRARYGEIVSKIQEVLDVKNSDQGEFDWSTGLVV